MPIDPCHLDADRRKPRKEVRDWTQSRTTAGWIFFGGTAFLGICVLSALGQPSMRAPLMMGMMIVYVAAMTIMTFLVGAREGLLGAFFFWEHPFSSLDPDSHPKSPVVRAVWALIFMGIIASTLVMMYAPGPSPQ